MIEMIEIEKRINRNLIIFTAVNLTLSISIFFGIINNGL